MNCQQPVFTKTPFGTLIFGLTVVFTIWLGGFALWEDAMLIVLASLIPPVGYLLYWYFIKDPVCPICKARHFEKNHG
jgi:hypothetical protein